MVYAPSKKTLRTIRLAVTRLKRRWATFRPHPEQSRLWHSTARFRWIYAGRRSGKSDIAKRHGVRGAFSNTRVFYDFAHWTVFAGPTGPQMHNLYWDELTNRLIPQEFIQRVDATYNTIRLWNGAEISVVSLEKGMRNDGRPIDALYVDEFADVKPRVWDVNLRPSLSTEDRYGTAWLYGVPRGGRGGHFHQGIVEARKPSNVEADVFHWTSASVLEQTEGGRAEIASAKRTLDERTYLQEYEADFQTFSGRAYYPFEYEVHAGETLQYRGDSPLVLCFDFNRNPGVAVVAQEQTYRGSNPRVASTFTAFIDEVWIPHDSNTRRVCEVLVARYGKGGANHKGKIHVYGDATGGFKGRHTVPFEGTDWTEVESILGSAFPGQVSMRVPLTNPGEHIRVNAVNARLKTWDGSIHALVDPEKAPHLADDFDSVTILDGTMGDLDKESDKKLTHLSDAAGYYIAEEHPLVGSPRFEEREM